MFAARTLFVVGAGASSEAGFPVGYQLAEKIARALDFHTEFGDLKSGDAELYQALRRHCGPKDFGSYLRASRLIQQGIQLVRSIDNFIDAHRENGEIACCGKFAIAQQMLLAEASSELRQRESRRGTYVHLDDIDDTWFAHFARMLVSDVPTSSYANLFSNVSFISFNYDRTIEQFLRSWLARVVGVSDMEATPYLDGLQVLHPYGSLGPAYGNHAVPFAAEPRRCDLPTIANNIRTYTEQVDDESLLSSIQERVSSSSTIVFLGFHFHEQNMRLLSPTGPVKAKQIFATAKGFSGADTASIANMLSDLFRERPGKKGGRAGGAPEVFVRNDLTCSGLFKEYQRSLRGAPNVLVREL